MGGGEDVTSYTNMTIVVVDSEYISRQIETITADVELTNIQNRFKQLFKERFNKK